MTYTDHFLTFPDEATFSAMPAVNGEVDVLGTLYRDDTGEASAGFHVNVRTRDALPAEWQAFEIERPANPKRVFL